MLVPWRVTHVVSTQIVLVISSLMFVVATPSLVELSVKSIFGPNFAFR